MVLANYYIYANKVYKKELSIDRFIIMLGKGFQTERYIAYQNNTIANFFKKGTPLYNWAAPSEFVTYRLCEQQRFRRACASAQSRQNLRCSLIQTVSQEEPSDRKPDPWPL